MIQNYQVIMYGNLGMSNTIALTLTAVYGTLATFSAVMTALYFDKLGRKPVLVGEVGMPAATNANIYSVHLLRLPNHRCAPRRGFVGTVRGRRHEQCCHGPRRHWHDLHHLSRILWPDECLHCYCMLLSFLKSFVTREEQR